QSIQNTLIKKQEELKDNYQNNLSQGYEVISFQIQESYNLPRIKVYTGKLEEEEFEIKEEQRIQLIDDEKEEKHQNQQKYFYYLTTNSDTLMGLSIKFNISEAQIKMINEISDTIFPGMKLKFPIELSQQEKQKENIHQINNIQKKSQQFSMSNIQENQIQETHRYSFYYCTSHGNIMGCLSINENVIMFDPSLSNAINMKKLQKKRVIKFQACIDIKDINEAISLILPSRNESNIENAKDYILQICLSHIGNKDIYKKYKNRLKELKNQKKSISTIFFRLFETDQNNKEISNDDKKELLEYVVKQINQNVQAYEQVQNGQIKDLEVQNKGESEQIDDDEEENEWKKFEFTPKLAEKSQILTDNEQFLQIIFYVPSMFKFTNWRMIYQNLRHGTSFQTLYRNVEEESPFILIIQNFYDEIFGAYVSDALHCETSFYGTGECFLFKLDKDIKVFNSTGKNESYIYSDLEGFAIGCGEQYGLYVNKDLYKGQSHKCDTFDNDILCTVGNYNDFKIKKIEIWGLDM
ncbi:tld family protein, putative, partial [Ichthyophthirius multifiliis]